MRMAYDTNDIEEMDHDFTIILRGRGRQRFLSDHDILIDPNEYIIMSINVEIRPSTTVSF